MKHRKPNTIPWYMLTLTALLLVLSLVITAGVSLARYRSEREASASFQVRPIEAIYLGILSEPDEEGHVTFQPMDQGNWQTVDGVTQLRFAVANGSSLDHYTQDDLVFQVRLISSLGLGVDSQPVNIVLSVPREDDPSQFQEYVAVMQPIEADSPIHSTFGDGWTFLFHDQNGKEMIWELEGGKLSYIDLRLRQETTNITDISLLQLQITAGLAED